MIVRVSKNRENPYVMINKSIYDDTRLSAKAIGILGYLLSKPDNWTAQVSDIVKHFRDGEKSIKSGLRELEKYGYYKKYPIRENGKITHWESSIFEMPETQNIDETLEESLLAQNVLVENVLVENRVHNNNELSNNDLNKKDIYTEKKSEVQKVKVEKETYSDVVKLTKVQYQKLIDKFGQAKTDEKIEDLNLYIQSKGINYKCHYSTILSWDRKESKQTDTDKTTNKSAVPQYKDYDQRKYNKDFFDGLYKNINP
ncbi:MAG: helix-turn-helix domain-containing protein [Burkholderiales bacterium]|nr:MAG: helix-turn-helix domain-containing protein [Burkholderiales bacterium]